jgi:hypothetical protein
MRLAGKASWAAFARSFGKSFADISPRLQCGEQRQARIDGMLDLVEHELKFSPVALILALSPGHIPRGKMILPFGSFVR